MRPQTSHNLKTNKSWKKDIFKIMTKPIFNITIILNCMNEFFKVHAKKRKA